MAKKKRVTALEYAEWLVSLQPIDTLASPTLVYTMGGANHFGITPQQAERLYGAARKFVVQRKELRNSRNGLNQWDGTSSMASAVPGAVVWWEWASRPTPRAGDSGYRRRKIGARM